jgi:putative phosphoesterase
MPTQFTVGLISDTHGLLRPEALERLKGADHIIHAGDIGAPGIVERLRTLAPTTAIRGNIDKGAWAGAYPDKATVHVVHALADLDAEALPPEVSVVVFGHSHRARIETRGGRLLVNPGSAGPRRFRLPVTLASLAITDGRVSPQIHDLEEPVADGRAPDRA